MQTVTTLYSAAVNAPKRSIQAILDLYTGDALTDSFQSDRIVNIEIQRAGEQSKFFGFGVSHKATIKLLDKNRELDITKENYFKLQLGIETLSGVEYKGFPKLHITEVKRDEKTNELTITACDVLNNTTAHTTSELSIVTPYTVKDYADAIATFLTGSVSANVPEVSGFALQYNEGANIEGTETLRDILNAIAEVTQTIYYIGADDLLHFRRLSKDVLDKSLTKDIYIDLTSGANRTLQTIVSATELGDNYSASTTTEGETQYVRDNPFWELREDVATLVDDALAEVGNMAIHEFSCEWRGDPALEPGDRLAYVTKDDKVEYAYLLSDTLTYNGGLRQKTDWSFKESDATAANPTNLGDALKQTFARVDKANKQVNILVSQVEANSENLSSLQLNTETIAASVKALETNTSDQIDSLNGDVSTLTKQVSAKMTADEVKLEIQSELANGVSKVETNTGFTFDDTGLTVSKTGSEMETTITEDGMTVYKDKQEMLVANNEGVNAVNLHATTYLIIGNNSRLEDWEIDGEARTACFWIG